MARRIFLHVGTPKTGTTYLQSVLWANKAVLKRQGALLPLKNVRDHFYLSVVARNAKGAFDRMPPHGQKSWQRMLREVAAWRGDVVISHELFAVASSARAAWTIHQLGDVSDEVHVIVTGRDFARQVPAEWQQTIKHGRHHRLDEYIELLKNHESGVLFWRVQNLPAILANWAQGLPAEHVHLITVPPSGAPRGLLWQRFATLIGVDPDSVDQAVTRPNESLGAEEIETLRRVNAHLPDGGRTPRQQLMMRQVLAEKIMAQRPGAKKFALPPEQHGWIVEAGTAMVEELRALPYDIVGDLDELLPPAEPARGCDPAQVNNTEVARVAVETIAELVNRTARTPGRRLAPEHKGSGQASPRAAPAARSLLGKARGVWTGRVLPRLARLRQR
jgi:hypothetical protein